MGVGALTGRRAVFLDRDGVLNRAIVREGKPYPPKEAKELLILPGVPEACRALREAGFTLVVVTNQPDVGRGLITQETVEEINHILREQVPLDDIYICYHSGSVRCGCRKPEPGLILQAAHKWEIDLASSFMIGDRDKDIQAGQRAGCKTILIEGDHTEPVTAIPDFKARSLLESISMILQQQ